MRLTATVDMQWFPQLRTASATVEHLWREGVLAQIS
jgi:hypothetical protein